MILFTLIKLKQRIKMQAARIDAHENVFHLLVYFEFTNSKFFMILIDEISLINSVFTEVFIS